MTTTHSPNHLRPVSDEEPPIAEQLFELRQQVNEIHQAAFRIASALDGVEHRVRLDEASRSSGPAIDSTLLKVTEAALALRMSRSKVFTLIADGKLDSMLVGRKRCVPKDAIERFCHLLLRLADGRGGGASRAVRHQDDAATDLQGSCGRHLVRSR